MERMKQKELGQLFLKNFPVNKDGWSDFVSMEHLMKISQDFKTTNGCDWARSDTSWLGRQFIIYREKTKGRVSGVQLQGFNVKKNHSVPSKIRNKIFKCAVLDISSNIEIDHKSGRYEKEEYEENDFQGLNKTVNDAKRQHCKECRKTGIRFDGKRLGSNISYISGNERTPSCKGCYWNDPQLFWKMATKERV